MAEYNPSKIIKDGNTYNFRDTTKIPLAGSNEISGSLIPSATDTYNFGSPTAQWNNAYIKSLTINGVACGDILTHNASEFVGVSGDQTIGGTKIFRSLLSKSSDLERGTVPTTNINENPIFISVDKNGRRTLAFFNYYNTSGNGRVVLYAYNQNTTNYDNIGLVFAFDNIRNSKAILPVITNAFSLGTPANSWKDCNTSAINGLNPGALSLPGSSYINVDTTNWDLTCQNGLMGSFTPTADGWLMLHVANSGTNEVNFWIIGGVIRISNKSTLNTLDSNNFNMLTIPVEKDKTYNIYGNASEYVAGRSIECRFMPCQGNV